ncbi:MAG TPA: hypothetical protein VF764_12515 [Steroidobacteraceae bacterium]
MTTPPESIPVAIDDRRSLGTLRARVKDLETVIDLLGSDLSACRLRATQLHRALQRYGTHAYTCRSEHGRHPKLCSCGLHEALGD